MRVSASLSYAPYVDRSGGHFDRRFETYAAQPTRLPLQLYDDLYLTEQPYGLVFDVVTDLPANDSSNAAFT
jgi:hypothetical protein